MRSLVKCFATESGEDFANLSKEQQVLVVYRVVLNQPLLGIYVGLFCLKTRNPRNVFGDTEQPAAAAAPAAAPFPAAAAAPEAAPEPPDPATQMLYQIQQQVMELEKQARNGLEKPKRIHQQWLNASGKTIDMNHQGYIEIRCIWCLEGARELWLGL